MAAATSTSASPDPVVLVIDVETTGCMLQLHSMVALGVALLHVNDRRVIETRRWTMDTAHAVWEERCLREFWSKWPAVRDELTKPPAAGVEVEPDATGLLTPHAFASSWTTWIRSVCARYSNVKIWSDFPGFDIAWTNYTLALGNAPPVYYSGGLACPWLSSVDTDSYVDGLAEASNISTEDLSAFRAQSEALFPAGDHLPEKDAACTGLRCLYLRAKILENALHSIPKTATTFTRVRRTSGAHEEEWH